MKEAKRLCKKWSKKKIKSDNIETISYLGAPIIFSPTETAYKLQYIKHILYIIIYYSLDWFSLVSAFRVKTYQNWCSIYILILQYCDSNIGFFSTAPHLVIALLKKLIFNIFIIIIMIQSSFSLQSENISNLVLCQDINIPILQYIIFRFSISLYLSTSLSLSLSL